MVQWLHDVDEEASVNAVANAASEGHLQMVQWLTAPCFGGECPSIRMDQTAVNGHLDVLRWLHDNDSHSSTNAMNLAAANGHLGVVQWLHEHRSEVCERSAIGPVN